LFILRVGFDFVIDFVFLHVYSPVMAFETEYDPTWITLYQKRSDLHDRRSTLEADLSEVNTQIEHLNEILKHLAPLAGMPGGNLASLGLTNAVRWVLENAEDRMSPTDVRDKLTEKGFDLSALTAPMGSIYKILSRLADDSKEISREKEEGGRNVFYRWKKPEPEISDDDIPF
jgi:hypothetical protein